MLGAGSGRHRHGLSVKEGNTVSALPVRRNVPVFAYLVLAAAAYHAGGSIRRDWLRIWWLLAASGVCLAAHFGTHSTLLQAQCTNTGAWVWGLHHTSVAHALLFVTSVPLLLAGGAVALQQPISRGEVAGAACGFSGMLILCAGASTEHEVTIVGDLFSLLGAVAIIGYLQAGRAVRSWLPVFMYALPVTAAAAAVLCAAAVLTERPAFAGLGAHYVLGFWRPDIFPYILYLALGPGIVGHTGFNFVLRYLSPFVISMAFPLEPVVGSVMAWVLGIAPVPSVLTWLGGAVMVMALTCCTYCESMRVASKDRRRVVEAATAEALSWQGGLDHVEMAAFTIGGEEGDDAAILFDSV